MNTIEIKHTTNHELVVKVNSDDSSEYYLFYLSRESARRMFLEALQACFVPGTDDQLAEYLLNETDLGPVLRRKITKGIRP